MPVTQQVRFENLEQWAESYLLDPAQLDYTVPLKRSAVALKADVTENFQGSHGPDGKSWPALRFPRAHGRGGDKPLLDTGLLEASVTANGPGHVETIADNQLTLGTNLPQAGVHQHGAIIRPVRAQALAIPRTKEAARIGSPRNWQQGALFLLKPSKGSGEHAFLAEAKQKGRGKGQRTELTLHYILVRQVSVPARPFLGVSEKAQEEIDTIFLDWMEEQAK